MRKFNTKRRFKAYRTVAYLAVYIALIIAFFAPYRWGKDNMVLAQRLEKDQISVQEENIALRDKLERSREFNTPENVKELSRFYIRKYFPQSEWATAEKIAKCESGLNPASVSKPNKNKSIDRGMWQINSIHKKSFKKLTGIEWEIGAHDLDLSTKFAKEHLFNHQGWFPWTCRKIV